jgi:hypothetical protein
MSQPPFQNPQFQNPQFPATHHGAAIFVGQGAMAAILTVVRPEEIPAALSQHSNPVLIDIPEVQWRLSWLAYCKTAAKLGGRFGWWVCKVLATILLTQWVNAHLPIQDHLFPDWLKFNFERQPDNKIILRPPQQEE